MITHLRDYVIPAAYALLPPAMNSREATALLLAIALQESECCARRQHEGGPARGFWQFEKSGVVGVLRHHATKDVIAKVCEALVYPADAGACYAAIEHNDTLAAAFARCLLYTLPSALPTRTDPHAGWLQYLEAWRPGVPRPDTWDAHYARAWSLLGSNSKDRTQRLELGGTD